MARGAQNDATRNGRWINFAYREISNTYDWPFTEVSATGSAGVGTVTVADVRKVKLVGDVSQISGTPGRRLEKITFEELAEYLQVEDVTLSGTPEFWWYDVTNSQLATYPRGGTVYVRYHKRLDELTGVQSPVFDEEYHNLIVDRAMVEVFKDTNEPQLAADALAHYLRGLGRMAQDYQIYAREHSYIQVIDPMDG